MTTFDLYSLRLLSQQLTSATPPPTHIHPWPTPRTTTSCSSRSPYATRTTAFTTPSKPLFPLRVDCRLPTAARWRRMPHVRHDTARRCQGRKPKQQRDLKFDQQRVKVQQLASTALCPLHCVALLRCAGLGVSLSAAAFGRAWAGADATKVALQISGFLRTACFTWQ